MKRVKKTFMYMALLGLLSSCSHDLGGFKEFCGVFSEINSLDLSMSEKLKKVNMQVKVLNSRLSSDYIYHKNNNTPLEINFLVKGWAKASNIKFSCADFDKFTIDLLEYDEEKK